LHSKHSQLDLLYQPLLYLLKFHFY